ncbi:MAG: V-type ATP synthase subunit F [Actinobacteria bacterium]|nr:V-type ATP synthase subunit F [Actinomycetota bacterium]
MKIGMIGGNTSTMGFKALGVETFPVVRPESSIETWKKIKLDEYGIIFITEPIYEVLKEVVEELDRRSFPVITVIPAVSGSRGIAKEELRQRIEKAVGMDIMPG